MGHILCSGKSLCKGPGVEKEQSELWELSLWGEIGSVEQPQASIELGRDHLKSADLVMREQTTSERSEARKLTISSDCT